MAPAVMKEPRLLVYVPSPLEGEGQDEGGQIASYPFTSSSTQTILQEIISMAPPVKIIGMGVSPNDLTEKQIETISAADILVGGKRLLAPFDRLACRKVEIDKNLHELGDFLEKEMVDHEIVILTSGDPLFFGIGAYLTRRLGAENVQVLPNVSAVASAFARLKEPWQDTRVVSLHGRNRTGALLRFLSDGESVAVYTDPSHDPTWLADLLIDNHLEDTQIVVLENLGANDERITHTTPNQAKAMTFSDLNIAVLKPNVKRQGRASLFPGMPDEWFAHEKGLITKAEIRAVTLSRLRLFDRAVFWDLGAGSGSISIEAGQFITRGEIFAVEQNAERIAHIYENCSRFAVGNLSVIEARLPEGLDGLPRSGPCFHRRWGRKFRANHPGRHQTIGSGRHHGDQHGIDRQPDRCPSEPWKTWGLTSM